MISEHMWSGLKQNRTDSRGFLGSGYVKKNEWMKNTERKFCWIKKMLCFFKYKFILLLKYSFNANSIYQKFLLFFSYFLVISTTLVIPTKKFPSVYLILLILISSINQSISTLFQSLYFYEMFMRPDGKQ